MELTSIFKILKIYGKFGDMTHTNYFLYVVKKCQTEAQLPN